MHFLPDVFVTCDTCKGKRYNRETLEVKYRGQSIADVLAMTVDEAVKLLRADPADPRPLLALLQGRPRLHRPSASRPPPSPAARRSASSWRKELAKRATGRTLYILDEPTTGLHFDDIAQLLDVLHALVDQGNTVLVIEHNLEVIKTADHVSIWGRKAATAGAASSPPAHREIARQCGQPHRPLPDAAAYRRRQTRADEEESRQLRKQAGPPAAGAGRPRTP